MEISIFRLLFTYVEFMIAWWLTKLSHNTHHDAATYNGDHLRCRQAQATFACFYAE